MADTRSLRDYLASLPGGNPNDLLGVDLTKYPTPPPGDAATIDVGTTTTLAAGEDATVANSGTTSAAIFDFGIPRGPEGPQGVQGIQGPTGDTGATGEQGEQGIQGPEGPAGSDGTNGTNGADGAAATITVGTVTTLPAGSDATVTNSGTEASAIFDFGIPQGADGTGTGDMSAATYDPNAKASDAFSMDNMDEGTDAKIMTAAERTKLSGIASGATANTGTVTSAALSVPTGLSVSGSPITTSGTFAISYSAGYQGYTSAEASKLSGIATGATANTGTVTSVAASVPTGFSVSGAVTTSGTLAITYAAGYQGYTATEAAKLAAVGTMANRAVTISSSDPSGGANGDVWFKV